MLILVALFAILLVAISTYGLISPPRIVAFAQRLQTGARVWAGSAIRLVFAVALWLAAPSSATPLLFRVFAVVALLGALALPAMGSTRFDGLMRWWSERPVWFLRVWLMLALAFGLFTLWSSAAGLHPA